MSITLTARNIVAFVTLKKYPSSIAYISELVRTTTKKDLSILKYYGFH